MRVGHGVTTHPRKRGSNEAQNVASNDGGGHHIAVASALPIVPSEAKAVGNTKSANAAQSNLSGTWRLDPSRQLPTGIELRDTLGVVFQSVIVTEDKEVAPVDSSGVAQLRGKWQGQGLEAEAQGSRGGTMEETYALTDDGKTLKITTKVLLSSSRPPIEFSRTYARVGG